MFYPIESGLSNKVSEVPGAQNADVCIKYIFVNVHRSFQGTALHFMGFRGLAWDCHATIVGFNGVFMKAVWYGTHALSWVFTGFHVPLYALMGFHRTCRHFYERHQVCIWYYLV